MLGHRSILRKLTAALGLVALIVGGCLAAGRSARTVVAFGANSNNGQPEEEEERNTQETTKKLSGSEALFKHHRAHEHIPSPELCGDLVVEPCSTCRPVVTLANLTPALPRRIC